MSMDDRLDHGQDGGQVGRLVDRPGDRPGDRLDTGDADLGMIRDLIGRDAADDPAPDRKPDRAAPAPRRPRTDTRLVDPALAPDLPDLADRQGYLPGEAPGTDRTVPPLVLGDAMEADDQAGPEADTAALRSVLADPAPMLEAPAIAPLPEPAREALHADPEEGESPTALERLTDMIGPEGDVPQAESMLASAYAGFAPLADRLTALDDRVMKLTDHDDRAVAREAQRLHKKLRDYEPSVVLIGQVKAGKTTLVNALIGRPGLLPADVNPWTSVVTSLHLAPEVRPGTERASFRFFDEQAWTNLLSKGGRMGELASRAGANDELERVRAQLAEMREKSRARLGRRFEMLLGQTHDYDEYGEALIERYVCLGDDFWEDGETSRQKGRFADITRSADLWMNRPEVPLSLCLRDTPGVNDTFMIREQITIGAVRGSRLCVVVLSASQALSTVDLALIRLISTLESRNIVIFVNRIDELADPVQAVPEIDASIRATLDKHDGPANLRIIFGSGHWGSHALTGDIPGVGEDSATALLALATARPGPAEETATELLWRLSGLPELCGVLGELTSSGTGTQIERQITAALTNLQQTARSLGPADGGAGPVPVSPALPRAELAAAIDRIEQVAVTALDARLEEARLAFDHRTDRARGAFVGRATAALLAHLESYGEGVVWSYDPVGLRTLLRSSCKVHQRDVARIAEEVFAQAAREFGRTLAPGNPEAATLVTPPPVPEAPPPVALGQTIALDLRGSWWNRFWRRTRGYAAFAESFTRLIHEETAPIIADLRADTADRFEALVRTEMAEFFDSQREVMLGLPTSPDRGPMIEREA